jgi:hypothetical protein
MPPAAASAIWEAATAGMTNRVFKNRPKYDLKSNQIICQKIDLKSQSNRHFPK